MSDTAAQQQDICNTCGSLSRDREAAQERANVVWQVSGTHAVRVLNEPLVRCETCGKYRGVNEPLLFLTSLTRTLIVHQVRSGLSFALCLFAAIAQWKWERGNAAELMRQLGALGCPFTSWTDPQIFRVVNELPHDGQEDWWNLILPAADIYCRQYGTLTGEYIRLDEIDPDELQAQGNFELRTLRLDLPDQEP